MKVPSGGSGRRPEKARSGTGTYRPRSRGCKPWSRLLTPGSPYVAQSASRSMLQQCGAHAVPDAHEGNGTGSDTPGRACPRAVWPQGREIVTHAPTLLHGERTFLKIIENAVHRVLDDPHHKTVQQRDLVMGPGTGLDAPPGRNLKPCSTPQKCCSQCSRSLRSVPANAHAMRCHVSATVRSWITLPTR